MKTGREILKRLIEIAGAESMKAKKTLQALEPVSTDEKSVFLRGALDETRKQRILPGEVF